jgi:hypothetical protein
MTSPPIDALREAHARPNPNFHGQSIPKTSLFPRPAYSDDGCRRKQSSDKPGRKARARKGTMLAARQLFEA